MSNTPELLAARIRERFQDKVNVNIAFDEVTVEVLVVDDLKQICTALSSEPDFSFAQLIDVCGVDYLTFGKAEWETGSVSGTGFSRGVIRTDNLHIDVNEPSEAPRTSEKRFAVVYHLLSVDHNNRIRLTAHLPGDNPVLDSVIDIWSSANWFEREAFDLYGIMFKGHPDLRRILTDYGFIGHPFRKDFPLIGNIEMRYDAEKRRVIYEPVSIEPRTLVPKVIREDQLQAGTSKQGSD